MKKTSDWAFEKETEPVGLEVHKFHIEIEPIIQTFLVFLVHQDSNGETELLDFQPKAA